MKTSPIFKTAAGCCAVAAILAVAGSASAQIPYPNAGTPVTSTEELFANGGDVTVTFQGKGGAGDPDFLFLASPGSLFSSPATPIFLNQANNVGDTVDLGTFSAGTELVFGMFDANSGNTWFTGPASRNADGIIHAYTVNGFGGNPNDTYVGFEDLPFGGSDLNYQDLQFTVSNAPAAAVPDANATLPLLGMSLAGMAALGRRFRK